MNEIRLVVAGTRDGYNPLAFQQEMAIEHHHLTSRRSLLRDPTWRFVLIVGGAKGVDTQAEEWGRDTERWEGHVHEVIVVHAEWDKFGLSAGPRRNARMLEEFKPTNGLIFPGGRGTSDMMNRLFAARIPFRFVGKNFE